MKRMYHAVCACHAQPGSAATLVARAGAAGADVRVQSVTLMATRKVAQLMNSTWDAVVTSVGKETFRIRRRKDRLSSQCPLRCYESELRVSTDEH